MTNYIEKRRQLFKLLAEVCTKALEVNELTIDHIECLESAKQCLANVLEDLDIMTNDL